MKTFWILSAMDATRFFVGSSSSLFLFGHMFRKVLLLLSAAVFVVVVVVVVVEVLLEGVKASTTLPKGDEIATSSPSTAG